MRLSALLQAACYTAAATAASDSACLFADADSCTHKTSFPFRVPTAAESAVMGRRVLALTKLGTLATVFPSAASRLPGDLAGVPIGLMDYFADCEDAGNPTVLAIKIATSFRNIAAGSNVSLSLRWTPPYPPAKRIGLGSPADGDAPDPVPYSAANLPRLSLFGYTEWIDTNTALHAGLARCFTKKHPDAGFWLPGNRIHESAWMRLVVTRVYWIGGFGDRAYIGWIPVEDWRNVTQEQWSSIRLQGERKDWNEWDPSTVGAVLPELAVEAGDL